MDTILLFRRPSVRAFLATVAILSSFMSLIVAGPFASATTTWNDAESVTFTSGVAKTTSQWTDVWSVSCPTAGTCVAVGEFTSTVNGLEGFTARSSNGTWQQAEPVTFGTGVAAVGQSAATMAKSVSCASTSFCVAVGSFRNAINAGIEAFTTTFSNGSWSTATPAIFAAGVQNNAPYATFNAVSCPAVGQCVAVGQFTDATSNPGKIRAFTMTMTNGSWGEATPAVFAAGINVPRAISGLTRFLSVSCASAGNCTAGGQYDTATQTGEAFTMTMANGSWGQATPVEFPAGSQNSSRESSVWDVSCAVAGHCIVSGGVNTSLGGGSYKGFTQSLVNGTWSTAQIVQFDNSLQVAAGYSFIYDTSCSSVGNCVAVGEFENIPYGQSEAFVMTMTGGVWGAPTPVVFPAGVQKTTRQGYLQAVSCPSDGHCTAVGQFWDQANNRPSFTVSMTSGVWGTALPVAFPAGLQNSNPDTRLRTVACASPGNCVGGGYFFENSGNSNYFGLLVSSINNSVAATPTTATLNTGASATTTTIGNAATGLTTTTVAPRSLPATGSDMTLVWLLAGMICVLSGAVAVRLRHRMQ